MRRLAAVCLLLATPAIAEEPQVPEVLTQLRDEAAAVADLAQTDVGRDFLAALAKLPAPPEKTVYYNREKRAAMTQAEHDDASVEEREGFTEVARYPTLYYTLYSSPVAYLRAIDLAAMHGFDPDGARVCDYGFGNIGQMRALASLGADVRGAEISELCRVMYEGDEGPVQRIEEAGEGEPGAIAIGIGRWPGDDAVAQVVGGGLDLFISKNTLKRGYVRPEREASASMLIDLGVTPEAYLDAVHDALEPGGLLLIYNLSPKLSGPDEDFVPWSDGRCPWSRAELEAAGFEVLAYDVVDNDEAREMGAALGWGESMELESDLFGMYTAARRSDHSSEPTRRR